MRLIDAEVAKEMLVNHAKEFSDVMNRKEKALLIGGGGSCIDKCPTIDAMEVVREKGEWIPASNKPKVNVGWKCSKCKARITNREYYNGNHNYCHKCGADMR